MIVFGAVAIGLLSIAVFPAGHHPWSVTFGFTVWGAKIASARRARISPMRNSGNGRAQARARRFDS